MGFESEHASHEESKEAKSDSSPAQITEEVFVSAVKQPVEEQKESAAQAENKIMDEINKLFEGQTNSKIAEADFTDEQLHYTVTNPVKIGSVVKYAVIG